MRVGRYKDGSYELDGGVIELFSSVFLVADDLGVVFYTLQTSGYAVLLVCCLPPLYSLFLDEKVFFFFLKLRGFL